MKLFTRLISEPLAALYRHLKWLLSAVSTAMSSLFVLYLEINA
jgi:hypothetical protein